MRKRTNDKVKKEYYQLTYRDIYWEEYDEMRNEVNKMWDMLSEEDKKFLGKMKKKSL